MDKKFADKLRTLTDADISSERCVSRRSVLSALGLGLSAAAAAVAGSAAVLAQAPTGCTDNDVGAYEDPPGYGIRCRPRDGNRPNNPTGCTDADSGPNEDPPGFGVRCWV